MFSKPIANAPTRSGVFDKLFAGVARFWADRRSAGAFSGMSEREFQDIGWGQGDRYRHTLSAAQIWPGRPARLSSPPARNIAPSKAA